jgi:hypothetical protein
VSGLMARQFHARRRLAHVDEIPVQSHSPFISCLHKNQRPDEG